MVLVIGFEERMGRLCFKGNGEKEECHNESPVERFEKTNELK